MLGYSSAQSAREIYDHHLQLKQQHPIEVHPELDYAYEWMKTRTFLSAIDHPNKESWTWLHLAMKVPPTSVIEKFANTYPKEEPLPSMVRPLRKMRKPLCRLCHDPIADTILETTKFSQMICACGKMLTHTPCAETYERQCCVCKQYFIHSAFHANVRSTIERY